MEFNDPEWRHRSSERLKAMHADPVLKARVRLGVSASHADRDTQIKRSDLGGRERAMIVAAIDAGIPRQKVADHWAISKSRLNHIVSEERRGVNSRGKDRLGTAILYIVGAAGYEGIHETEIVNQLVGRFGYSPPD